MISQIWVGTNGRACVVDAQGRLIAHPDISLVLQHRHVAGPGTRRCRHSSNPPDALPETKDRDGRDVDRYAREAARWFVFVELPANEAYGPLYAAVQRLALVLLAALIFAVLAGMFLARRMVGPIQALQLGAARIGGGDLSQRISIRTGDELEGLADQFNEMAARVQESHADLENKVELRTRELSESLEAEHAAEVLAS